ncbi:VWA domain-containing protein [Oculatella sp. FACHB-28]|uniref:vWA domain-containing protein n=1 Tax=Cyanophyceae TaxID=3028117 RepID=UPI0016898E62|nr:MULTISPECIES: VWA domain-containing protein [Cyanophyceae]MBD1870875.1 VWA domain-containing protein [Cyanobacteria bacterium FACHB-471]MBD2001338.1 VWA domain-containing protein [Leptolyngbya sp. FACHB-541]MBD2058814.1 VWA domain-containing protein [Oculatella sp. FACHB-28]MBD2066903.1 VWA domain-containing protein [Leptolyngbya sp. FACHB-671]
MRVGLQAALNDANLDAAQSSSQRQLAISISAIAESAGRSAPLNLCLVLDHSGSMHGRPLETVKQAAHRIVDSLSPGDRIAVVVFDHKAKVLVPNQVIDNPAGIKVEINKLKASGGTAIDEGMRLGVEELAKGKKDTISQAFLLTDGENEHGDNDRCLKLAQLAAGYNLTLSTLGFGDHWNQDVLERIADAGGGTLSYIQQPEEAVNEFSRLFNRIQSVGLTNAHLMLSLTPNIRLAELKPLAQVVPDTIELSVIQEANQAIVRLGDLMVDAPRVVLANLYASQLPEGRHPIAYLQIRYDDPAQGQEGLLSEKIPVEANVLSAFQPDLNPQVQQHVLALAKYRQTQIAESKLLQGDRVGAATMLQSAAKTALQMGDQNAATVLQDNATRLQSGEELSESDRKKTRIVSKTVLQ